MIYQGPKAFLSYARSDRAFALRLAQDLKKSGGNIWVDQLEISPGAHWDKSVEDALQNCPQLLVVLSPASVNSRNVMDEVSYALEEEKQVVPVVYQSCRIPYRLRRLQYVDLTANYEKGIQDLLGALNGQSLPDAPAIESGPAPKSITETSAVFHEEHFAHLMRAVDKKDLTDWNQWRQANPALHLQFQGADLRGRYLREADLRNILLVGARLAGALLGEALLQGADLRETSIEAAHLEGAKLDGADLRDANLMGARIDGASLRGADLRGARLEVAYLRKACLCETKLMGAHLDGARMEGACLEDAHLGGTYLKEANLMGACLDRAYLGGAYLGGAFLREASLKDADLMGANLEGAHLGGADLSGANLTGTQLQRAILLSASGLSQEQINKAVGDIDTCLPEDLHKPDIWPK